MLPCPRLNSSLETTSAVFFFPILFRRWQVTPSQIIAPGSLKAILYSSRWHAGMLGRYQVASLMIAQVNTKTNISLRDLGNIHAEVAGWSCVVQVSQDNFRVLWFVWIFNQGTSRLLDCAICRSKSNTLKCNDRKQRLEVRDLTIITRTQ